jgi:hypothetical protein
MAAFFGAVVTHLHAFIRALVTTFLGTLMANRATRKNRAGQASHGNQKGTYSQ